jgi:hypothetical protein
MNKKAKRRAFFICAAIFVMYVMVGLGLPEKMSAKRLAKNDQVKPMAINMYTKTAFRVVSTPKDTAVPTVEAKPAVTPKVTSIPAVRADAIDTTPVTPSAHGGPDPATRKAHASPPAAPKPATIPKEPPPPAPKVFVQGGTAAEPLLFISVPIVCYALKEGLIEKEGLIFIKKQGYNNVDWKKPLDILKDKDEEGLRSISKAIGKNQLHAFLKKEGITQRQEISPEDIVLGKGYTVEKKKLLSLYDRYVSGDYLKLFPFVLEGVGMTRGKNGFELLAQKDTTRDRREKEDPEWMMPNLVSLPIKDAIEKLSNRTARIKVFGSGTVIEQDPKPFQKIHGETACVLYGRAYK